VISRLTRRAWTWAAVAAMAGVVVVVKAVDNGTEHGAAGNPPTPAVPSQIPSVSASPDPSSVPEPTATRAPKATPTTTRPAPPTPGHGEHAEPDPAAPRAAAAAYLTVFFNRTLPTPQWRARLARLSTAAHTGTLATVPRVVVPNLRPTRTALRRISSSTAVVYVALNNGTGLLVGLVLDEAGWKVSRVIPANLGPR
jgi:hypothetical protein